MSSTMNGFSRYIRNRCSALESIDFQSLNDPDFHEYKGEINSLFEVAKTCRLREISNRLSKMREHVNS